MGNRNVQGQDVTRDKGDAELIFIQLIPAHVSHIRINFINRL